jgi:hypothetical protein
MDVLGVDAGHAVGVDDGRLGSPLEHARDAEAIRASVREPRVVARDEPPAGGVVEQLAEDRLVERIDPLG